jgi:hypothetical protein
MATPSGAKRAQINSSVLIPVEDTAAPMGQRFKYVVSTDLANSSGQGGGVVTTVAEFRASDDIPTNISVVTSDYGGGTWYYLGTKADDDGIVDNLVTTIITADNHIWRKVSKNIISAEDFGAIGDGTTDNRQAFFALATYLDGIQHQCEVVIPAGLYKINLTGQPLIFKGNAQGVNAPILRGEGKRNTILDFSGSTGVDRCIQWGHGVNSNTHAGGMNNIQIIGNLNMDGIILAAEVPYTVAFNTFSHLRFYDVRDAIGIETLINAAASYRNQFNDIEIEKYSRNAVSDSGAYPTWIDVFVVYPNPDAAIVPGQYGADNLGLLTVAASPVYINFQSEDQCVFNGGNAFVMNLTIENITKTLPSSIAGQAAIKVAGYATTFINLRMITMRNDVVNAFMYVYALNTTILGFNYANPGNNALYRMTYPIQAIAGDSSGIMMNHIAESQYPLSSPTFAAGLIDWTLINIKNTNTDPPYSKIAGLDLDLNKLLLKGNSTDIRAIFNEGINIGSYGHEAAIDIEGNIDFQVLQRPVGRIKRNNIDALNGGVTIQYIKDFGGSATSHLTSGSVTSITVDTPGSYSAVPEIYVFDASNIGKGAKAHAVLTGTALTSIVVDAGGAGFIDPPVVAIVLPSDGLIINQVGAAIFSNTVSGLAAVGSSDFITKAQLDAKKSAASADTTSDTAAVGATYSQTEVQTIITEMRNLKTEFRDLKTKMRTAVLLAP